MKLTEDWVKKVYKKKKQSFSISGKWLTGKKNGRIEQQNQLKLKP